MLGSQLITILSDSSSLLHEKIHTHVGLVLSYELKLSFVVLFITPMSYGLGPGVRISVSASPNFPANEDWSVPIRAITSRRPLPQFESNEVYLKQCRLLYALRTKLMQERWSSKKSVISRG